MIIGKKNPELDPNFGFRAQRRNILSGSSAFNVREAYKTLRTNIRFSLPGGGCKKLCITSSLPGEGKTITAINLALSFAESGLRVLLIDADLRRPALARLLIETGTPGLSNILAGMCSEDDAIMKDRYPNLDVIFSGVIPPNPSELLSSAKTQELLNRMAQKYDYIFIDTPPVNVVTDACILASGLDGVLFVVRQNQSDREAVSRGVNQVNMAGAKILGFVLNGVPAEGRKRYGRYRYYNAYGYGYSYEAKVRSQRDRQEAARRTHPVNQPAQGNEGSNDTKP